MKTTVAKNVSPNVHDEQILVVKRNQLLPENAWQGIAEVDFEKYLKIIQSKKEFLPRSVMETDPSYKQIIPYLVFKYDGKLFLTQRRAQATETRLKNKFSLGIGGHIREEDMTTDSVMDWAMREFHEEVDYKGKLNIKPIGILNDDSNDVGKVHIGFVFLLEGDSDKIKVKSELKSGQLYTFDECDKFFDLMENWSQTVFTFLKK